MRAFSRQVNGNPVVDNLITSIYDDIDHSHRLLGRGSVQSRQFDPNSGTSSRQMRGTLAGMQDMFKKFFG